MAGLSDPPGQLGRVPGQRRPEAPQEPLPEEPLPEEPSRPPHFVQSLARGLAVIRAFDADHPDLTLSEVAHSCGLSRAAARRFLLTLADLGYVRADRNRFRLTPRVLELGYAYVSGLRLPDVATPHLEQLVAEVGESASLAVLDGLDIVYVARVTVRRIMSLCITVGTRFPAQFTAMGRVLLAHLPDADRESRLAAIERLAQTPPTPHALTDPKELDAELHRIREQGYALMDQELELGLRSIAVPVRDRAGTVVAAINLPVPAARIPLPDLRTRLLPALRSTATKIESDLRAP